MSEKYVNCDNLSFQINSLRSFSGQLAVRHATIPPSLTTVESHVCR